MSKQPEVRVKVLLRTLVSEGCSEWGDVGTANARPCVHHNAHGVGEGEVDNDEWTGQEQERSVRATSVDGG